MAPAESPDLSRTRAFSYSELGDELFSFIPDILSTQPLKSTAFMQISATLGSTFAWIVVGNAIKAKRERIIFFTFLGLIFLDYIWVDKIFLKYKS